MRRVGAIATFLALVLASCGGGSGLKPSEERVESTPDEPVQMLNIWPRPPESAIPKALANLRGLAVSTTAEHEASREAVRRTVVERRYRRDSKRWGLHSPIARSWGLQLLSEELRGLSACRGLPTCPVEDFERRVAELTRKTSPSPP